jgi:hypothetical protein
VEPSERARFEEIFALLEKQGVARGDLVLAWDFTTASRESKTRRMLAARDDARCVRGLGPGVNAKSPERAGRPREMWRTLCVHATKS